MNELIQGVEILDVNDVYTISLLGAIILVILFVLSWVISDIIENPFIQIGVIVITLIFLALVVGSNIPYITKLDTVQYQCYLHEDKIDYKEFYERCDVVKQDGKFYTIELKDKSNED